jgi:hypothetical protein
MNVALHSMREKLAAENIYIINLIDTATYTKTFKLSADKRKLISTSDYSLFYNDRTILLFIACENLHWFSFAVQLHKQNEKYTFTWTTFDLIASLLPFVKLRFIEVV